MRIEAHYNLLVTDKGIEVGGAFVPRDMALRIHEEVANMRWCKDDGNCPCYQAGYRQGLEDVANKSHEH